MAVTPGYKQTEVGAIPDAWTVTALGSICDFENGDRSENYPPPESFVHSGVPFINAGHLANGRIDTGQMDYISPDRYQRLRGGKVRSGDTLFCLRGSLGKYGVVSDGLVPGAIASSLVIIRPRPAAMTGAFLACYLGSSLCWRMIDKWAGGAAQPNLGVQDLARFSVMLPPTIVEQEAIATALGDVDALMDGLDRLVAKKRDLKQAAMLQLLTGQTRLPGFGGEWQKTSLSAVCSMKSGEGITSANIGQFSRYPCYGGNGLRGYTNRFTHDGTYALVGRQGALCGNVFGVEGQFFASEHAIVVTTFEDTDIRWLTYVLGRMNLNQYSESSAQPGLSVSKILKLEITAPPTKAEQAAIAEVLSGMDAELTALEARRRKTGDLKQAMMQELLTGKARLVPTGAAHA